MNEIVALKGRRFPAAWPFGLVSIMVVSILGLSAVIIDVYLVCRYLNTAPANLMFILSIPIGVHPAYQLWRIMRYRTKIREVCAKGLDDGSPCDLAVRVAAEGMIDVLFFSYGTTIMALIVIGLLLSKLSGV